MENSTDALKMAAAVLIFVGAISLAIFGFTKAREAATAIMEKSDNQQYYSTDNIRVSEDRLVGIETVIPTLYSYFKEGYTVLFYTGEANENYELTGNIKPLTLYYSEALPSRLSQSTLLNETDRAYEETYNGKNYPRAIYGIDANDEDTRQEPWLHDELHAKMFIQSLINNTPEISTYDMSRKVSALYNSIDNNKLTMNFDKFDGLTRRVGQTQNGKTSLSLATDALFVERIGTYNTVSNEGNTTDDSSIIEFSNNEVIQNDEGTQKRVIQYIYVGKRK